MPTAEQMKGVSVSARVGARATTYGARYTLRDGKHPVVKPPPGGWVDRQQAFKAACSEQRAENLRTDNRGGQLMTVNELIDEFYLAGHKDDRAGTGTRRTRLSHLGDGTGVPKVGGPTNTTAARSAVRFVFGSTRLRDLTRPQVVGWQDQMVACGRYKAASITAKRGLLKAILQVAVLSRARLPRRRQGWSRAPLGAAQPPQR